MTAAVTLASMGNGPAFSALASSNQAFGAGTSNKVLFQTEVFDTNNCFASSTFTPTTAGYYLITSNMATLPNTSNEITISLYKNGAAVTRIARTPGNSSYGLYMGGSYLIYLNGTTDYVEIYCYTAAAFTSEHLYVYFNGSMVRGA